MFSFLQDLKFGLRMLGRSPALSIAAILTLALGIGANVAIFSFVDAIWLRPLPVRNAEQLVRVYTSAAATERGEKRGNSSYPDIDDLRAQARSFAGVATSQRRGAIFEHDGEAKLLIVNVVSDDYLSVLGATPVLGRGFATAHASATPQVMLSYDFWQKQFGGDRGIVGRQMTLNRRQFTVAGVVPHDLLSAVPLINTEIWVPISTWSKMQGERADPANRDMRVWEITARLREGVTPEQAQAEVATIGARLAAEYPATNKERTLWLERVSESAPGLRLVSILLLTIAALVMLLACANVACLLLARAEHRRRETATRLALGASRGRLARQFLSESLLLAALAGAAAVIVARGLLSVLPALTATIQLPVLIDARIDPRALAFAAIAGLVAVLAFGMAPALAAARTSMLGALHAESRSGDGARRAWARSTLVVSQIAVSLMLVVATGLLVRSMVAVQRLDPGFNAHQPMLLVEAAPMTNQRPGAYYRSVQAKLSALPGVKQVAVAKRIPLSGSGGGASHELFISGRPLENGRGVTILSGSVTDGYFEAMGTKLLRGRTFAPADTENGPRVAVINRTAARQAWPDREALGQHFRLDRSDGPDVEVVGVVEDGKYNGVGEDAAPYLFLDMAQSPSGDNVIIVATDGDPSLLVGPVRERLREAGAVVLRMQTMREFMHDVVFAQRIIAQLVGAMGALGMLLAAVGLYGLIAYLVSRRTHEIGVRVALGATRGEVFRLVLGRGLALGMLGTVLGAAAALALASALSSQIFGVSARDPLTFVSSAAMLLVAAGLASFFPARRATKIEPMEALRYE